jgi:hypothetical protein
VASLIAKVKDVPAEFAATDADIWSPGCTGYWLDSVNLLIMGSAEPLPARIGQQTTDSAQPARGYDGRCSRATHPHVQSLGAGRRTPLPRG